MELSENNPQKKKPRLAPFYTYTHVHKKSKSFEVQSWISV